jgi:hypothetical protein
MAAKNKTKKEKTTDKSGMKTDAALIAQFQKHRKASSRGLSKQYENQKTNESFYVGDMMDYKDNIQFVSQAGIKKRAMVQFNKVKPYVNAVKGFMAQNRRRAKYEARMPGGKPQELYSMYANAMHDYILDKANADQIETQQDGDMLIGGVGAVETAMTYGEGMATTDPNGQIVKGKLDIMQTFWDPFAKATGLTDARWVGHEKDYDLDDALELFSDSEEQDFDTATDNDLDDDEGYTFYARGGRYNKIKAANVDWSDERQNMVKVYFYQWVEFETFYRCENPIYTFKNPQAVMLATLQLDQWAQEDETAEENSLFGFDARDEILNFGPDIKAKMEKTFGDMIDVVPFKRKVYYTSVLSGHHVFSKYRSQSQSGFSIKFKTGDYDSKNKMWTGMVNSMREPMLYYNKALTEMMFTIAANSKGGVMVEKGAVEDLSDFEQKFAKTDGVIEVEEGALSGQKIKPKREGYAPSGYEEIIKLTDASLSDVNGIDKTFLGSSENKNETGILQKRRIKQVVSALACYFDSITLYQKEAARLDLDYMRIWAENNAGGVFKLLGPDGRKQFLQISADKLAADYDVMIEEAPQSQEEKMEYMTILSGIADKLLGTDPQTAKAILAIALKHMPLDQIDLQRVTQLLVPNTTQIDPAMVQQMAAQLQKMNSDITQVQLHEQLSKIAVNNAKALDLTAKSRNTSAGVVKTKNEGKRVALENVMLVKDAMMPAQVKVNI